MLKKKPVIILAAVLVLALGVGIGAYAASNYGTQSDPLVAKSYLDNVLTPKLQEQFQAELDQSVYMMEQEIAGASTNSGANFASVSLLSGQTIKGDAGCEIILRSGSAACTGSTGLADVTDGAMLASGDSISQNHLLTVAAKGDGITASGTVTVLVRGGYSIV